MTNRVWFAMLLGVLCGGGAQAIEWRPVEPAELAQKTPKVDPAADAEAIFWDVRIEDRLDGSDLALIMNHYIRIKIFTERGKEQFATVEIPRTGKRSISDVAARTIKADGSIIDLKKDSIFDRELVQTKGLKLRGKTFALPNVEVGDIIEYQYKETRENEIAEYLRLYFQREIPLWNVAYHLKPLQLSWMPYSMRMMSFQCQLPPMRKEPNGFFMTALTDVPAFKTEPYMPPDDQLRAWALIFYEEDKKLDAEKFWKELGKADYARFKPLTKPDGEVKRVTAELISGFDKPEDQLAALDSFCRTKIRNVTSGAFHSTAEERKAVKENHSAGDTLKQKAGRGLDIDYLFVAMATAAGFDARIARIPDRSDSFFNPQRPTTYFINNRSVAVKVGDNWTFFDPSTPYLERGMLRWQEEGQRSLVSDPKEGFFAKTQYSSPQRSQRQRTGNFKLRDDGTLEGTVQYVYTGHVARRQKEQFEDMTPAQQEQDWKETLQNRLSTAEMSEFTATDAADAAKPVTVRHKISIPGYATRTGKRILLQPAFFQRNVGSRFSESARKWDIYFDFGWAEDDEVTIELPDGWDLDQPTAPKSTKIGELGDYKVEVRKTTDGRKLIYRRHFDFGRSMMLLIPVKEYDHVKTVFDFVQEQDGYTVSLKAAASAN
jgi:hypothetical protein